MDNIMESFSDYGLKDIGTIMTQKISLLQVVLW